MRTGTSQMPLQSGQPGGEITEPGGRALGYMSLGPEAASHDPALHRQAEAIERACRARELYLGAVVRERDSTRSDATQRPGLKHALEHIVRGEASTLVVARLEHLGGSAAEVGSVFRWFENNYARLIADDLDLDTGTRAGWIAARALIEAGDLERSKLGDSTRRGLAAAREKGTKAGRPSVADRPELRERIIELRERGLTLQAIADRLNADGVPTTRGGAEWRPSSVQAAAGYKRPGRTGGIDDLPGAAGLHGMKMRIVGEA